MPPAVKKQKPAPAAPGRIPLANLEELAAIWSNDARIPTVESRKAWCAARSLDYGLVNRQFWWRKSAKKNKADKENLNVTVIVKGPRGGCYELPVGTPPVIIDVKQEEVEAEEDTKLSAETVPVKIEMPSSPSIPSSDTLCPSSPSIPSSDTLCPSSPPPLVLKKSPSQEPEVGLEDIPVPPQPQPKRVRTKGPARKRLGKKSANPAKKPANPAKKPANPAKKPVNPAIKEESTVVQDACDGPIVEEKPAIEPDKPAPVKRKPDAKTSSPASKRVRFDSPCPPLLLDDPTSHYCDGSCDLCSLPLPDHPDEIMTENDNTRLEALYPWYFQPTYEPVFKTMPSDIPKELWCLSAVAYESIV